MKVCIVSSCGGHLTEVLALRPAYEAHDHFFILNKRVELSAELVGRTHFITHAERDWRVIWNLWQAWRLIRRERPDVILSTGAGPVVPVALVGRLHGIKTVFVETWTRVNAPSLTGRIMYRIAAKYFYQWPQLGKYFPKGVYGGSVL